MSRQDDIARKAVRKSTLKCIKEKKQSRIAQLKKDYEQQLREINIQYAEDPERLKAKYAAADYAKSEKAQKRAERRIEAEKKQIELSKHERRLTVSEEIGSSIIQGIGAALFIAATAILDTLAIQRYQIQGGIFTNLVTVFYSLFGASMILMYLFSTLQHALTNLTAKEVFNRLSHIFTYVTMGVAYAAYSIVVIGKTAPIAGWIMFGIVSALVLLGIMFYAIAGRKFNVLNTVICCIAGFAGLVLAKQLHDNLGIFSFSMLILAAGFYLVGVIFYNLKKIKFMHLAGNCFLLAGSIYMFFSLFSI